MEQKSKMLRHRYAAVRTAGEKPVSYGGNQAWLFDADQRAFGCGLIAAADILRYLGGAPAELEKEKYLEEINTLAGHFHLRGKLGINGFGLARGMNKAFRKSGLPYRAKWSVGRRRLMRRLSEMLESDIPVLLSVGPGFFHKEERLPLYRKQADGTFQRVSSMRDHYVVVTGWERPEKGEPGQEDFGMLRISSWGEMYYISFDEYLGHVKKYDNFLFSSILYIRAYG